MAWLPLLDRVSAKALHLLRSISLALTHRPYLHLRLHQLARRLLFRDHRRLDKISRDAYL